MYFSVILIYHACTVGRGGVGRLIHIPLENKEALLLAVLMLMLD
jgi:hypothetical protein